MSHTSLWRKVTLIKPHLIIELIKSATLFFVSVSVFVCVWGRGEVAQSLYYKYVTETVAEGLEETRI